MAAHSLKAIKSEDLMAEGMRFELTKQFDPFTRFPGERLQPLGHPSSAKLNILYALVLCTGLITSSHSGYAFKRKERLL